MKFNEPDFERTAQAVYAMNPYSKDRFGSPEGLKNWMIQLAHGNMAYTTNLSTGGFLLTSFVDDSGEVNVIASVSAYTAHEFLKTIPKPKRAKKARFFDAPIISRRLEP